MLIHEAFDKTLRKYSISAKALSQLAKISEAHISRFRNGKGGAMAHNTLEDILSAMEQLEPGSKSYFYLLLAGKDSVPSDIDLLVELMDDIELSNLLSAIARRVSPKSSSLTEKSRHSTERIAV
ncbi:helix-turn-helix transcriptional regulator [Gloeocapsa sp. BRSZ]